jgi:hypothetical protein
MLGNISMPTSYSRYCAMNFLDDLCAFLAGAYFLYVIVSWWLN